MKILFFGSSSIAKSFLVRLYKKHHKIFIITIPDKNYIYNNEQNLVKIYAQRHNIDFIQPDTFLHKWVFEKINEYKADVGIVINYGKVILRTIFELPKYKTFNIHFSLLPKYRGAAPVQHALCNGENETGITAFYIDQNIDTGNIIMQKKLMITYNDNAKTLMQKLIPLGISVMESIIHELHINHIIIQKTCQKGIVSLAPRIKKSDGLILWNTDAITIYNKFRGFYLWPGVYSKISTGKLHGKQIKFLDMEICDHCSVNHDYGIIESVKKCKGFVVSCKLGKILITKIQLEGKTITDAWSFLQGRQLTLGDKFSL